MIQCTVVYSEQGCGKTKNHAELMCKLGCNRVIDIESVTDLGEVPFGTLVITNDQRLRGALNDADVIAINCPGEKTAYNPIPQPAPMRGGK